MKTQRPLRLVPPPKPRPMNPQEYVMFWCRVLGSMAAMAAAVANDHVCALTEGEESNG